MLKINRRDIVRNAGVAAAFATTPFAFASKTNHDRSASVGAPPGRLVDPELWYPGVTGAPTISASNLVETRARMMRVIPPYLVHPKVNTRSIPGLRSGPEVRITLINTAPTGSVSKLRPALIYLHGGGFVAGSAAGEVAMAQQIALDHDCVIISVDYRLAPETRFPGPLDDNYAVLKWAHRHANELGIDPDRIALMGTSAGGGHAAMLSATAKDRGEVPILFQLLISPMLDDRTGITRSVAPDVGKLIWTVDSNRFGWSSLLGVPAGSRTVPEGAVPSRRHDLTGLPPTYIGVGALDLFVEENIAYATQLLQTGVPVELNVVPGAYHVFFAIRPNADVSRRFKASFNNALAKAFHVDTGRKPAT